MYIVSIAYTAPVSEVDYLLPDHVDWLNRHYAAGHFIASGGKPANDGRVILTRPMRRERLEVLLATDPLKMNGLVRHEIVEFKATRTAPGLLRINEALTG
jgi:uncharacterized protein YciI